VKARKAGSCGPYSKPVTKTSHPCWLGWLGFFVGKKMATRKRKQKDDDTTDGTDGCQKNLKGWNPMTHEIKVQLKHESLVWFIFEFLCDQWPWRQWVQVLNIIQDAVHFNVYGPDDWYALMDQCVARQFIRHVQSSFGIDSSVWEHVYQSKSLILGSAPYGFATQNEFWPRSDIDNFIEIDLPTYNQIMDPMCYGFVDRSRFFHWMETHPNNPLCQYLTTLKSRLGPQWHLNVDTIRSLHYLSDASKTGVKLVGTLNFHYVKQGRRLLVFSVIPVLFTAQKRCSTLESMAMQTFDVPLCTMAFNGRRFQVPALLREQMIQGRCEFKIQTHATKDTRHFYNFAVERIEKYLARGITFYNVKVQQVSKESFVSKTCEIKVYRICNWKTHAILKVKNIVDHDLDNDSYRRTNTAMETKSPSDPFAVLRKSKNAGFRYLKTGR
jgi:hypothetical protein